jgi:hypothetical protein
MGDVRPIAPCARMGVFWSQNASQNAPATMAGRGSMIKLPQWQFVEDENHEWHWTCTTDL